MTASDWLGRSLGPYKLILELGKRASSSVNRAVVFRAEHIETGQIVALKVLPPAVVSDPEYLRRFRREYKIMESLEHPRLIKLREFLELDGVRFYTMQFVEAPTLEAVFADRPEPEASLGLARSMTIGGNLLDALAYLHGQGIIHRDVKPENIFVTPEDDVLVGDFGLAKISRATAITMMPSFLGTIDYASPEQMDVGQTVDHRSDVYQAGLVLFHMLGGKLPFNRRDLEDAINCKCFSDGLVAVATINPQVPAAVSALVEKATRTRPAERYQSAAEMLDALRALVTTAPA